MPKAEPVLRAWIARVDDVNPRDRSMVATINTNALDRYRTCIDPRGIDCKNYMQNRVVLWEHGRDPVRGAMPIGRNEWVRPIIGPDGPELRAKTFFYQKGKKGDDFTERLFECYKDGDMRAWSVNVVPKAEGCSPPTKDEIRARPELVDCWQMYRSTDLGEYSAVAVGGNPETLTADEARSVLRCVDRGLALPTDLVELARRSAAADDDAVYIDPEIAAARLARDGSKYVVLGLEGREAGRHDAEPDARRQLAGLILDEDDEEYEPEPAPPPAPEPELPPLGGRSYADAQAERLEAFTRAVRERTEREAEQTRALVDWYQGRV